MRRGVGFVPLPEVGEYTDDIIVGHLGLPVGVDPDTLELHVGRTLRRASLADLGELTLSGFQGERSEYGYGVGSVSGGTASAVGARAISKAAIRDTSSDLLDVYTHGASYDRYRGAVRFNNAEIAQRIKNDGDKWAKGEYDSAARAHYMDRALKQGIMELSRHNILGDKPASTVFNSLLDQHLWTMGTVLLAGAPSYTSAAFIYATQIVPTFKILDEVFYRWLHAGNKRGHPLPPMILSAFRRKHYDRMALTHALTPMGRLIRSVDPAKAAA